MSEGREADQEGSSDHQPIPSGMLTSEERAGDQGGYPGRGDAISGPSAYPSVERCELEGGSRMGRRARESLEMAHPDLTSTIALAAHHTAGWISLCVAEHYWTIRH